MSSLLAQSISQSHLAQFTVQAPILWRQASRPSSVSESEHRFFLPQTGEFPFLFRAEYFPRLLVGKRVREVVSILRLLFPSKSPAFTSYFHCLHQYFTRFLASAFYWPMADPLPMSDPTQQHQTDSAPEEGLKIWSCVICRRRKVKCDRRDPCGNCTRANVECHFPVTGRIPRRSRNASAWESPAQRQAELISRLRRLETVVTELTAQVEESSAPGVSRKAPAPPTSVRLGGPGGSDLASDARFVVGQSLPGTSSNVPNSERQPGSEFDEEFGRLVVDNDGSIRVGNQFWSVFCDEVGRFYRVTGNTSLTLISKGR